MIVDCHTHVWESLEQLGRAAGHEGRRGKAAATLRAGIGDHQNASKPVDKTFVLGIKSHYLRAEVPNDFVAGYVRKHENRLIGFAALDPSRPREAISELRRAHEQLGMRGVTVWPAGQDFHPSSTSAMRVYAEIAKLRLPVLFMQDVQGASIAKLEFARPFLLDEVAREFPELKMVVSGVGYPWIDETLVLLAKHANVFAEISGLLHQPWQLYRVLVSAYQAGVLDGLLFGSHFPYSQPAVAIEAIYSVNQFCQGTNLPNIPREQLRQLVERNTLELLGIEADPPRPRTSENSLIHED